MRLGFDFLAQLFAHHQDCAVHQIPHDLFDVAANIANLGELGGLDLKERRVRQFGQTAADLGFAHTCWPDHQDVLWVNFVA